MSDDSISSLERRTLGRTGESVSVIGFGGVLVHKTTPEEAASIVAEAVDRGVNYFDVAPRYGEAQERLGPALKPHRDRCFLTCKSYRRSGRTEEQLHESLRLLQTDRFDGYLLHGLRDVEKDVDRAFAPGGAMDVIVRAREAGKIRYIGFSAHSEEAAMAAMDRFDFDYLLFPLNYAAWTHGRFGPSVVKRAREKGMGVIALKSLARTKWPEGLAEEDRSWPKCWYEPVTEQEKIGLYLRFTLGLGVDVAIPPGHWELFLQALAVAENGPTQPLDPTELERIEALTGATEPLFPQLVT